MYKSFRGGSGNVVLGLDICGSLVAACGTDKMCRIWNTRTERLVSKYQKIIIEVDNPYFWCNV
jgi:WD40 repeat protein